jgi:hypothetical protein
MNISAYIRTPIGPRIKIPNHSQKLSHFTRIAIAHTIQPIIQTTMSTLIIIGKIKKSKSQNFLNRDFSAIVIVLKNKKIQYAQLKNTNKFI